MCVCVWGGLYYLQPRAKKVVQSTRSGCALSKPRNERVCELCDSGGVVDTHECHPRREKFVAGFGERLKVLVTIGGVVAAAAAGGVSAAACGPCARKQKTNRFVSGLF
jgi:hypothetical protein